MIQFMSRLNVADNTGARSVGVIKILGNSRQRYATVGDIVKVSVKDASPNGQIKKGQMSLAVIVRVSKQVKRQNGNIVKFDDRSFYDCNDVEMFGRDGKAKIWHGYSTAIHSSESFPE